MSQEEAEKARNGHTFWTSCSAMVCSIRSSNTPLSRQRRSRTSSSRDTRGVRTKSLFLVNRKKNRSYLVIMDGAKELDLGSLAEQFGESRLSFGSPERLQPALGFEPGIVSPFEMLDPYPREVKLCFDEVILTERS